MSLNTLNPSGCNISRVLMIQHLGHDSFNNWPSASDIAPNATDLPETEEAENNNTSTGSFWCCFTHYSTQKCCVTFALLCYGKPNMSKCKWPASFDVDSVSILHTLTLQGAISLQCWWFTNQVMMVYWTMDSTHMTSYCEILLHRPSKETNIQIATLSVFGRHWFDVRNFIDVIESMW